MLRMYVDVNMVKCVCMCVGIYENNKISRLYFRQIAAALIHATKLVITSAL